MTWITIRRVEAGKSENEYIRAEGQAAVGRSTRKLKTLP